MPKSCSNAPRIRSPYFGTDVVLNADGLHHLRYSDRRERSKPEQMLKFRGFVGIIGSRPDKIRVIVRRVGTGNLTL